MLETDRLGWLKMGQRRPLRFFNRPNSVFNIFGLDTNYYCFEVQKILDVDYANQDSFHAIIDLYPTIE